MFMKYVGISKVSYLISMKFLAQSTINDIQFLTGVKYQGQIEYSNVNDFERICRYNESFVPL